MADFIQSRVTVVHEVSRGKPTSSEKETRPTIKEGNVGKKKESAKMDEKGILGRLGSASVKRRLANYTILAGQNTINRMFDGRIFSERYYGDVKSAQNIQNTKSVFNDAANMAKSAVGALITSGATGNPYILAVVALNMAVSIGQGRSQYLQQMEQYNRTRELELFISSKRNHRVNVGTYNRRR